MPTKLSRTCDAVIEASWLAALIVVPLFFNVLSARVFEPDKITLLRSLVLFMVGAFAVKLADEWLGSRRPRATNPDRPWWRTPLLLPAVALAIVYVISTIFSITPWASLLGSYQRLQGTYTTLSYIVVFAMILATLRRREQVDRLVTVAILTSLPIGLYGMMQHFGVDPLPWGGDTQQRIASNMGNSIFVAAYLIMILPLTAYRLIESCTAILRDQELNAYDIIRAAIYVFILFIQLIGIYWSQSRGPQLGILAGLFFGFVLLSVYWRARALTFGAIAVGAVLAVFLIILNVAPGPFGFVCEHKYIGRMCTVLEIESGTGKVRALIWEGAVKLIAPHEPLHFPDGSTDAYNFLRPLIGYGPEGMYVAYNPFYPPDLAHYEARNASPDRSHNETFDALVITGLLGLVVQMFLYGSVFYFGLKWLGLIRTRRQAQTFAGFFIAGGLLSATIAVVAGGPKLFGVGLPFGMTVGLLLYIAVRSILADPDEEPVQTPYPLLLIALLSAIVAHFVEIHFGIAIVSTRTYFWTYAGLMVVIGYIMVQTMLQEQATPVLVPVEANAGSNPRKTSRPESRSSGRSTGGRQRTSGQSRFDESRRPVAPTMRWLGPVLLLACMMGVILATLGYEFIGNPSQNQGTQSAVEHIVAALTTRSSQSSSVGTPFTLGMILLTWLAGGLLVTAEMGKQGTLREADTQWWIPLATYLGVSMTLGLLFWLVLSGLVTSVLAANNTLNIFQISLALASLLNLFYFTIFALVVLGALGGLLSQRLPGTWMHTPGALALAPALIIVIWLIGLSNLGAIQADMVYKQADPIDKTAQSNVPDPIPYWDASICMYRMALNLAPREDFYYLWLGRAFLESATDSASAKPEDPAQKQGRLEAMRSFCTPPIPPNTPAQSEQQVRLNAARDELIKAQTINPLNTDHTANLGRLHRRWADLTSRQLSTTTDPAQGAQLQKTIQDKALQADQYYQEATALSPHNAQLWNEWGSLLWQLLRNKDEAMQKFNHSLELDQSYVQTYLLLGTFYMSDATSITDTVKQTENYTLAIPNLEKAIELDPINASTGAGSLGTAYSKTGTCAEGTSRWKDTIAQKDAKYPYLWQLHKDLAVIYQGCGQVAEALDEAQLALNTAPQSEQAGLQTFVTQIKTTPPPTPTPQP